MANKRLMRLARRLNPDGDSTARGAAGRAEPGPTDSVLQFAVAGADFVFVPVEPLMVFRSFFPKFKVCSVVEGEAGCLLRLAGSEADVPSWGITSGFSIQVTDQFELAASGQDIQLRVVARAEPGAAKARFAIAYSTNEVGNSGWRWFDAGPDWAVYETSYSVPTMQHGLGDFIGLLPAPETEGEGVIEIRAVAAAVRAKPENAGAM